jgi:hypothetical protein
MCGVAGFFHSVLLPHAGMMTSSWGANCPVSHNCEIWGRFPRHARRRDRRVVQPSQEGGETERPTRNRRPLTSRTVAWILEASLAATAWTTTHRFRTPKPYRAHGHGLGESVSPPHTCTVQLWEGPAELVGCERVLEA